MDTLAQEGFKHYMKNFRRILSISALAIAATSLASATTITGTVGTSTCVGLTCTVSVAGSVTGVNFQIGNNANETPILFSLSNFGDLGITGTYTGATFDFQYQNLVTGFKVTNNDGSADTATINITSQAFVDPATSGLSATEIRNIVKLGGVSALSLGFGGTGTLASPYTLFTPIYTTGSFTVPGTTCDPGTNPGCNIRTGTDTTFVNNVSAGPGTTTSTFNTAPLDLASHAGTGSFLFGITDTLSYGVTNNGTAGAINLNVQYNSAYAAAAIVTYTYTIPDTTATPEPATFAMFGGALLGLGLLRRNRK